MKVDITKAGDTLKSWTLLCIPAYGADDATLQHLLHLEQFFCASLSFLDRYAFTVSYHNSSFYGLWKSTTNSDGGDLTL